MELNNENIIISNIEKYEITFCDGNMILKKKRKTKMSQMEEIKKYNFRKSKILDCYIDDLNIKLNKYSLIIKYLYIKINNSELIKRNSLLNIVEGERNINGFRYLKKLNLSIQGVDANQAIKEIINISNICNIKIDFRIKLENDKIINL